MAAAMEIKSPVFSPGDVIPKEYTCDSLDVSPELHLSAIPPDTMSLALIYEDIDAPTGIFTHWIVYNIPADTRFIPSGIPPEDMLENGMKQGLNDFGVIGYRGSCPQLGTHRYYFRLYALNAMLDLHAGATKAELKDAMKGHIIAESKLMNRYQRQI